MSGLNVVILLLAVANQDPQEGGRQVGQIRKLVGTNLILGLIVVAIGASGGYL